MSTEPADTELIEEAPAPPKNRLMLLLVATNLLAVLGAGAALAYVVTREPPPPAADDTAEEASDKAKAEPKEDGSAPEGAPLMPSATGPMMEMDPFVVNLDELDGNRYLKLQLSFELSGEPARAVIEAEKPRVRDALITYLSGLRLADVRGSAGKRATKEGVHEIVAELVPRAVRAVYLTDFVVQ